jgi:transposase
MPRSTRYPPELRERAVRMVREHQHDYPSEWQAITAIANKLGPKPETLRLWVRQAQIDTGQRDGVTTDHAAEMKRLKRENAELRRANDILKSAASPRSDHVHRREQTPPLG